jgi:hypothetical protein
MDVIHNGLLVHSVGGLNTNAPPYPLSQSFFIFLTEDCAPPRSLILSFFLTGF